MFEHSRTHAHTYIHTHTHKLATIERDEREMRARALARAHTHTHLDNGKVEGHGLTISDGGSLRRLSANLVFFFFRVYIHIVCKRSFRRLFANLVCV